MVLDHIDDVFSIPEPGAIFKRVFVCLAMDTPKSTQNLVIIFALCAAYDCFSKNGRPVHAFFVMTH